MVADNPFGIAAKLLFLLTAMSGLVSGEIYGRNSAAFMYSSGNDLRLALKKTPVLMWLGAVLPVIAAVVSSVFNWSLVFGQSYSIIDHFEAKIWILVWCSTFVSVSDLRTRIVPEIITVPFLLAGLFWNYPDLSGVFDSVAAASLVVLFRYALGFFYLVPGLVSPRWDAGRLFIHVGDADWVFGAGCAAWVGTSGLLSLFMYSLVPTAVLIAIISMAFWHGRIKRKVQAWMRAWFLGAGEPLSPNEDLPYPIAGPIAMGLMLTVILPSWATHLTPYLFNLESVVR